MNNNEVEILLIEDNPTDAELTIRALKKFNLANNILVIDDGEKALEYIFAEGSYSGRNINKSPKVILLDLKLPKVSGLEILKKVKSDERTKIIPVVVLTSSREESDLIASYKLGVNSFIVKPVDFTSFVSEISKLGYYWLILNKKPS
ncbi:response regulator [Melioribacteraceae bacterium 4301-Me]|uniref:response regulator n=1 Tax=Pyranulibacter aquaticus TaxID=3163344 RepID=UPI0035997F6D